MLKKFNDIFGDYPHVFEEDLYLCNEYGAVLTRRSSGKDIFQNVFSILPTEEVAFIKENMSFAGFRSMILVDSAVGPIFFDLSLSPMFRLLMVIVPHISSEEIFSLARGELSERITPSPRMREVFKSLSSAPISDSARAFIDWSMLPYRSSAYCGCLFRTTLDVLGGISELSAAVGRFCGCDIYLSFDELDDDADFKNTFCFESYFFAIVTLSLFARNYSASRGAHIRIRYDELGIYFDVIVGVAEQYRDMDLTSFAKEITNLASRADERMFGNVTLQKKGRFVFRGFPWLRIPDSADLKEKKAKFIYDY